jgi:cathepsin C
MQALLLLALLSTLTQGDLPVHCLESHAIGRWIFKIATAASGELQRDGLSCGHSSPDAAMLLVDLGVDYDAPQFEVQSSLEIDLRPGGAARDAFEREGRWTMVADEGFEVEINNRTYFAFFRYQPRRGIATNRALPPSIDDFESLCHETLPGWWHEPATTSGCFIAKRRDGPASSTASAVNRKPQIRQRQRRWDDNSALQPMPMPMPSPHHHHFPPHSLFAPDLAFIELVNRDAESTWSATVHRQFIGHPMRRMMKMLGRTTKFAKPRSAYPQQHRDGVRSAVDKYAGLPASLDWRARSGGRAMTPVASQGACGSCYAIAAVDVASMRLRIGSNFSDTTILSPQSAMSCSPLNQGCDGGYPFLVAKHGAEIGLVSNECQPYAGGANVPCARRCLADGSESERERRQRVYKLRNYRYIGGRYGACSERAMMEELLRGPIVAALNAPPALFYYAGGVYSSPLSTARSEYTVNGVDRWEKTTHAVAIVGWGSVTLSKARDKTRTVRYWLVKNSWGAAWGEGGFFRLRRGYDDAAIESMAVAFEVLQV